MRVRFDLDGGHMDVSLDRDASAETVAALRELGQAAIRHVQKNPLREPPRDRGEAVAVNGLAALTTKHTEGPSA